MTHLGTLVESLPLNKDAEKFSKMLYDLVSGESATKTLENAGMLDNVDPQSEDLETVYKTFGPACLIETAMPVTAHFLLKCAAHRGFETCMFFAHACSHGDKTVAAGRTQKLGRWLHVTSGLILARSLEA
jgi:hypothetical protein